MNKYITLEEYHQLTDDARLVDVPHKEYEGMKLYPCMAKTVEGLKTWTVREDDIWIVTFMKAGTTWTQEIVSCIKEGGDLQAVRNRHTVFRGHFIEKDFPEQVRSLKNLPDTLQIADEMPSPRIFKTHLPGHLLPPQIWQKKPKMIYVLRNPKDLVVSFFHFSKKGVKDPKALAKTCGEFLEEVLAGTNHYGPLWEHNLYFWKLRHEENVLILRYEDMKQDLRNNVEKVSKFLGKNLSDEKLDAITAHCTFHNMKKNKMAQLGTIYNSGFMRKGEVGDWKNHFTVAQSEAMDALLRDKLHGTGLTFDYE